MTLEALERVRERNESLARQADPIRTNRRARDTGEGPTPEWLRKHEHQKAHTDQKTQASADRKIGQAEIAFNAGQISQDHFSAAKRLYIVYCGGVLGADVRQDDEMPGTPYDPDYPAREAMNSDIDYIRRVIGSPRVWDVLVRWCVEDEPPGKIGATYCRSTNKSVRKAVAMTLIEEGLDACAWAWGISQHSRSRDRPAA